MGPGGEKRAWHGHVLAAVVIAVAMGVRYRALLGLDLTQSVILPDHGPGTIGPGSLQAADLRFVVWLVARNAFTFLNRPSQIFQAEPCFPVDDGLALGEPGLTLGLLGTPSWLLSGDPVLTFHAVQLATVWIGAFAMYLLVGAWTGQPAAGIAAGLLFGLHPVKADDVVHPYVRDVAWVVLALYFAERLFAKGRWRDAAGLALCGALQMGGSLYPLAGAAILAPPALAWLLVRHGVARLRPGPVLLAMAGPLLAAALIFPPFLGLHAEGVLRPRIHLHMPWADLVPGRYLFPGWAFLGLTLVGLARADRSRGASPRWVLLFTWVVASYLAAGGTLGDEFAALATGETLPFTLPNLYGALASVVPGLDVVRAPRNLYLVSHVALGILAGLGAGVLLGRVPARLSTAASAGLVLVAAFEVAGPRLPGLPPRASFEPLRIAPAPERIRLFEELAAAGNAGPVFHAPFNPANLPRQSENVLLSAYHHRRTNACYASFRPDETPEMKRLGALLPSVPALEGVAALGFTTVVARRGAEPLLRRLEERFEAGAAAGGSRRLASTATDAAWALPAPRVESRPNIVLVIGDDHGWPDFGFMGSEQVRTPNLDRLAEEGIVFPQAFNTASSCRPSLLTLASGLHPVQVRARLGLRGRIHLPRNLLRGIETLPGLLAERGYATFQGGKWWEGSYADGGFSHGMTRGEAKPPGGDAGLALGRETMEPLWTFLEEHRDTPFFVWFAPMLPHTPFDAPEEYAAPYPEAGAAAPYFANITRFDARVGELMERLDDLGLREKTLVVYLADNGWDARTPHQVMHPFLQDGPRGKSSMFELGFRTPLVFHWPGVLEGGRREERVVSTADLFPTLLDVASLPTPEGRLGRSLYPRLRGGGVAGAAVAVGGMLQRRNDDPSEPRKAMLRDEAWFLRTAEWRLVWFPARREARLYRIDTDPFEAEDVSEARPGVTRTLTLQLQGWLRAARQPGAAGGGAPAGDPAQGA